MIQAQQITIVGTGLLGASLGLALKSLGFAGRVVGVGRRHETLERALARGAIDAGSTDLPAAAAEADLVVLATPIGQFDPALAQLGQHDRPGRVITDVGSTKQFVCDLAARLLPPAAAERFVGSHPMAGSEQHGPDAADAGLFAHRPCVVTPTGSTDPRALEDVEELWRTLGMRLQRLSPAEHDAKVACISHLPHAVAALLVRMAFADGSADLASTGFRDTTRIASGDPCVWLDIFRTNGPAMIRCIDTLGEHVQRLRQALEEGNADELLALLRQSKADRDAWVRGGGAAGDKPRQ